MFYNLHYPEGFLDHPDWPYPGCWLDKGTLFEWYSATAKNTLPTWTWRRDKPLIVDEFLEIAFSTRPPAAGLATFIGPAAADLPEAQMLAHVKCWPMETIAYRRQASLGFCAWSFLLWNTTDFKEIIKQPDAAAYCYAIRPLAVLDHSYRTRYFAHDEIVEELDAQRYAPGDAAHVEVRSDQRRQGGLE